MFVGGRWRNSMENMKHWTEENDQPATGAVGGRKSRPDVAASGRLSGVAHGTSRNFDDKISELLALAASGATHGELEEALAGDLRSGSTSRCNNSRHS
jgi:hypothetical protein